MAWIHSFYAVFIGLWFLVDHFNALLKIHEDKVFGYDVYAMYVFLVRTHYHVYDKTDIDCNGRQHAVAFDSDG